MRANLGKIAEIRLAATKLVPGPKLAHELEARYGAGIAPKIAPEPGVVPRGPKRRHHRANWPTGDRRERDLPPMRLRPTDPAPGPLT